MRKFQHLKITSFSTLALLGLLATGSYASDFQSPRTAALGGAGHAAPLLTDSVYLNPSFTSFLQAYIASVNYGNYKGGEIQSDGSHQIHGHLLNVGVQDGRNEWFQAGVGFTQKDDSKVVNIGASKAILEKVALGVGGKLYLPNPGNGNRTQDANLSGTVLATDWLQIVAVADNIINSTDSKAQNLYRQFIIGTKVNIQSIMLVYLDPHLTPNLPNASHFGYESGVELTPFSDLFVRAGMFRSSQIPELQNAWGRGYGAGIGWVGPKLSLDYGLKRTIEPLSNNTHNVGMTVFF